MRFLPLVLTLLTTTGARAQDPVSAVAWLAGCWAGTLSNGALYEETWLAPRAGSMLGMARMSHDDRTLSYEFMRISAVDDVLVFSAQPDGRPATDFRATRADTAEVVFENAGHDFPQRVRYRLTAPDSLIARIEGQHEGQERGFDFPLRRTACPGPPALPAGPPDAK